LNYYFDLDITMEIVEWPESEEARNALLDDKGKIICLGPDNCCVADFREWILRNRTQSGRSLRISISVQRICVDDLVLFGEICLELNLNSCWGHYGGHIGMAAIGSIPKLNLSGTIMPLKTIDYLTSVIDLNLSLWSDIKDVEPLSRLQNLESLDLSYCKNIKDIELLSRLQNLRHLNLTRCKKITDVEPLCRLQNLQSLNLSHCINVKSFDCLQGLEVTVVLNRIES
jgi:hypothetical protein